MKKIAALMLCGIMTLSLAACGGGGGTGGNGGGGNSGAKVSGEIIDTGVFSALLPDGWYNYPVTDMWSENDELDPDDLFSAGFAAVVLRHMDDGFGNRIFVHDSIISPHAPEFNGPAILCPVCAETN